MVLKGFQRCLFPLKLFRWQMCWSCPWTRSGTLVEFSKCFRCLKKNLNASEHPPHTNIIYLQFINPIPIDISSETIWAAERKAPKNEYYLELQEDQPETNTP